MALSSSEELEQAREDVERIGRAMFEEAVRQTEGQVWGEWERIGDGGRRRWTGIATTLLHDGVIHVGRRPQKAERPMTGQQSMVLDSLGRVP